LRRALGRERKVLGLQRRVGFKADEMAAIAQVKQRCFTGADRAALQSILIEVYRAEVFAVATVLPLDCDWRFALAFKVNLPEEVAAVFTLNGTLPRGEESSFVFGAKYSHFRSSLQRQVTVQVVLGTKHDIAVGGDTDLKTTDENNWREVCGYAA
jgi:hypothetical protein